MVIDFHVHLGRSLYGHRLRTRALLRQMNELGIARCVIVPPKPPRYHFEPANRYVLAQAREHPDRLTGFCRIDPWRGRDGLEEARRCLLEDRMAGLFLHPWEENFQVNDGRVDPLVAVADEAEVPVMIAGGHVRVSRAPQVADLVSRWPEVNFVITSGGQINVSGIALGEARQLFQEHPNTYLETSGIYRLDFIEDMAAELGPGRIVFGSDTPRYDQAFEMKRVLWAHRPEDERALMAGANAARLLRLALSSDPAWK